MIYCLADKVVSCHLLSQEIVNIVILWIVRGHLVY